MTSVVFENTGIIDPRAIWTFGVNVKESDNPVGYFGTGLKYALAVLLRCDCAVTIYAGSNVHRFSLIPVEIRGKTFSMVAMDGKELGFTTELGKNWEPWMAYRELYCNAKDEDGTTYLLADEECIPDREGCTQIAVEGDAIVIAHTMRRTFLLEDRTPRFVIPGSIEVYDGVSEYLFYRGIRAGAVPEGKRSKFTYNITAQTQLTEDRTIDNPYAATMEIERAIANSDDAAFIHDCVTEKAEDMMESRLEYIFVHSAPSSTFFSVVNEVKRDRLGDLTSGAVKLLTKHVVKQLSPNGRAMTPGEAAMLDAAKDFVRSIGFDCGVHTIRIAETLGEGTLALAIMKENTIVLSAELFRQGARMVALGLIEEHLHLITGAADFSRSLQTRCMEEIIRLGEELSGRSLSPEAMAA